MCTINGFKILSSVSPEQSVLPLKEMDCDGVSVYTNSGVVEKLNISIDKPAFFIKKKDGSWLRGYYDKIINPSNNGDFDTFMQNLQAIIQVHLSDIQQN